MYCYCRTTFSHCKTTKKHSASHLHHLILLTNKPQHNTAALLSAFLMTTPETELNENNVHFQNLAYKLKCSQELLKEIQQDVRPVAHSKIVSIQL